VPGGDSGELIVAACSLGIPHPPGYPLHTLLGYASIQLLPFGTPAARVTFVSVVCSAGASALIYFTIVHLFRALSGEQIPQDMPSERKMRSTVLEAAGNRTSQGSWDRSDAEGVHAARASAVAGAGIYSFSPLVWTYSTQAEVFSLNNLFAAALIFLSALYLVPLPPDTTDRETEANTKADSVAHPQGKKRAPVLPRKSEHTVLTPEGGGGAGCGAAEAESASGETRIREHLSEDSAVSKSKASLRQALLDAGMAEQRLGNAPTQKGKGGFYWASANSTTCQTLLVIIPGSGSSDGGLWCLQYLLVCTSKASTLVLADATHVSCLRLHRFSGQHGAYTWRPGLQSAQYYRTSCTRTAWAGARCCCVQTQTSSPPPQQVASFCPLFFF
jgi:hypothetical protein